MEIQRFLDNFRNSNDSAFVAANGDTFMISMGKWAIIGTLNYDLPAQFADLTGKTLKVGESNIHLSVVVSYGLIPIRPENYVISFTQFETSQLRGVKGLGFEGLKEPSLKLNQARIIKRPENVISIEFCEDHALLAELIDSLGARY